jgi:tetratricopeptide (TPR) repeat protein
MSLLIDALRKAEQARRGVELQSPPPAEARTELQLEADLPPEPPAAASPGRPALPAEAAEGETEGPSSSAELRAAARNLFEVKQAPRRRLFWPVVATLTTVAVAALGGYLWWELQPRGLTTSVRTATPRPPLPATSPSVPMAAPPASASTQANPAPDALAASSAAPFRREQAAGAPARGSFTPPPGQDPAAGELGPIRRGRPDDDAVPAVLAKAYAAYNAGDLGRAERLYAETLRHDPHSRDALDGLGAIALRQGRETEAEAWFRRSLAADPDDPVAQAGLADLRMRAQPEQGESRMKRLVAAQPEAAPGHFALGNALAAQARWAEAQQAYFQAHALDPDNPDYLFNLAVSLDQLRQPQLARRFYAQALSAAAGRAASFERGPVEARLQALDEAR